MSSRDTVLRAVQQNRPETVPLPEMNLFSDPRQDLLQQFCDVIREIGGITIEVEAVDTADIIHNLYKNQRRIISATNLFSGSIPTSDIKDPHDLSDLDVYVCEGAFGVAENGAVWLDEKQMIHRVAPFITQHLAVILPRTEIVGNMHEAYERLQMDHLGFGLFVAGPSKTADIEQSLVIGAHGPRSHTVFLL